MNCELFERELERYLAEELEGEARHAFREHLRSCAGCRARALEVDPTLALAATPPAEPDPRRVEECVTAVSALVGHARLERGLRSRRRPWLAAAAATLMAAAVGVLWEVRPTGGPGADAVPRVAEEAAAAEQAPPPQVELDMEGEDIRIYHFAGAEGDDVAVAFVVNPAMEL